MTDTGLKDAKGKTIYEESIIGLRTYNSTKYYDKVIPIYNKKREIYEFKSNKKSVFNPEEYVKYLCINDLYGFGSTYEVIGTIESL